MTKKHFIAIAKILKVRVSAIKFRNYDLDTKFKMIYELSVLERHMIEVFENFNSNFNELTFKRASTIQANLEYFQNELKIPDPF